MPVPARTRRWWQRCKYGGLGRFQLIAIKAGVSPTAALKADVVERVRPNLMPHQMQPPHSVWVVAGTLAGHKESRRDSKLPQLVGKTGAELVSRTVVKCESNSARSSIAAPDDRWMGEPELVDPFVLSIRGQESRGSAVGMDAIVDRVS